MAEKKPLTLEEFKQGLRALAEGLKLSLERINERIKVLEQAMIITVPPEEIIPVEVEPEVYDPIALGFEIKRLYAERGKDADEVSKKIIELQTKPVLTREEEDLLEVLVATESDIYYEALKAVKTRPRSEVAASLKRAGMPMDWIAKQTWWMRKED